MAKAGTIGIGLIGMGVVGGGVVRLLQENAEHFSTIRGIDLDLRRIAVRVTNPFAQGTTRIVDHVGRDRELRLPGVPADQA